MGVFPVAVRPKSGPEGRFTARKHYCITAGRRLPYKRLPAVFGRPRVSSGPTRWPRRAPAGPGGSYLRGGVGVARRSRAETSPLRELMPRESWVWTNGPGSGAFTPGRHWAIGYRENGSPGLTGAGCREADGPPCATLGWPVLSWFSARFGPKPSEGPFQFVSGPPVAVLPCGPRLRPQFAAAELLRNIT